MQPTPERKLELTDNESELRLFDSSPSKHRKFLRTIVEFYRIEQPTVEEKKVFCEKVVKEFFPYYKQSHFSVEEKKYLNGLIRQRVTKAGGFLRQLEQAPQKMNDQDFDQAYQAYQPVDDQVWPDNLEVRQDFFMFEE